MSQYKDGSVAVTNGSATVTGTSTLFSANVAVGDSFKLEGENATYNITAVGSNTSITISPVYAGATASGNAYVISKDFTPIHSMYEPNGGDVDWPFLLTTALRHIDSYLPLYVASQTPGANQIPVNNASGNLGIGITPSEWGGALSSGVLELKRGVALATSTAGPFSYLTNNCYFNGTNWIYKESNFAVALVSNVSGAFELKMAPSGSGGSIINFTTSLKVDSSGNLLVGATSDTTNNITKNNPSGFALKVSNSSATAPSGIYISMGGAVNSSGYAIQYGDGAGYKFQVGGNGNVQNTNNSYGAISDIKLKENIVTTSSKWNKFKQYRFVNYNLKADPDKNKLLGLVAQEVELVSPSLVEETPDFAERQIEIDGELQTERYETGETTKSVKYSVVNLEGDIVLQEAQARIETLEAKTEVQRTVIEQLEAKLATLEERLLNAGF